jgi:hypothetical protein
MRKLVMPAFAGPFLVCCLTPAQEPKPPDVPTLIRQLGDPDPAREAATVTLGRTPEAFDALRQAAADTDPGIAKRATEALAALRKRLGPDRLKRLPEYAKARQVDRLVEAMVAWPEAVTFDDRELPRTLAKDILAWAGKEFGPKLPEFRINIPDLDRLPATETPLTIGRDLSGVAWGDTIADSVDTTKGPGGGYHQFRGGLVSFAAPGGGAWFVNGDARFPRPAEGAGSLTELTVCNGDLTTDWTIRLDGAVILCTGDVRIGFQVRNSLIVAGGGITFTLKSLEESALSAGAVLRPEEPKLAEFLRFYDCASEGLHVRAEDKTVFVTKVDAGKPFAAAGVQPGDRVVKVNDVPVRSVRELNRLLCRAEVGYPGTAALFLARGEKGVDAVVKLADPPKLAP